MALAPAAATSWHWPATKSFWWTTAASAVSLPEVPLLGVLPGTGGLTRVTDKRHVRHDLADIFCTSVEGVRGPEGQGLAPGGRTSPSPQVFAAEGARARIGAGRPE